MTIEKYLKEVRKKTSDIKSFLWADNVKLLAENLLSMYDFSGFPETFRSDFFMLYAILDGWAAIYKTPDDWGDGVIACRAHLAGKPDAYGLGRDCIVTAEDGHSIVLKDFRKRDDVEVYHLNRLRTPDIGVQKTAYFLTETQLSIRAILLMARYSKIIEVPDDKTREMLKASLEASELGGVASFVSQTKPTLLDDAQEVKDISLQDVKNSDMIQYLSKYEDDVMRSFFNRYGMSTSGHSKIAQQTADEITEGGYRSMIVPISRLKGLQEWAEKAGEKLGFSGSVDLSEPWKLELAHLMEEEEAMQEEDESSDSEDKSSESEEKSSESVKEEGDEKDE